MVDEWLIAEAQNRAGCHLHMVIGWICAYRSSDSHNMPDVAKASEAVLRWFVSARKAKKRITKNDMYVMAQKCLDDNTVNN